ncbi:MAG: hypothetical protein LBE57_00435 [Methanosarcinales archaeon]|jgi:hypothetical protein|nr:hypothetical protein [Methanosarcinales archaeon]
MLSKNNEQTIRHLVEWLRENEPKVLKHPNVEFKIGFPNIPEPLHKELDKLIDEKLVPEHYMIHKGSKPEGRVEFTEKGFEYIRKFY